MAVTPSVQCHLDQLRGVGEGGDEADTEGTPGQGPGVGDLFAQPVAPPELVPPIMPKPPALETAAANSPVAVPDIEALKMGCSMPSN